MKQDLHAKNKKTKQDVLFIIITFHSPKYVVLILLLENKYCEQIMRMSLMADKLNL